MKSSKFSPTQISKILQEFESGKDINVRKLVALCKNTEQTIFSLMNINGINDNEVSL